MQAIHEKFCASLLASGLGLAALLGTGAASAQVAAPAAEPMGKTFGDAGTLSIAVDRLMGLSFDMLKDEEEAGGITVTNKTNTTNIALLGNLGGIGPVSVGLLPRLGFDYFVIDGLSVGTAFVLATQSGKNKNETTGVPDSEDDLPKSTAILFQPRVGYALMFNDMIGIWPRAGITYWTSTTKFEDPDGKSTTNALDLTIEAPVVISPVPHFAIFVAPFGDIGLAGKNKGEDSDPATPDSESDVRATSLGLSIGIGGYL